jgi:peroxiredoxin Q/BCP
MALVGCFAGLLALSGPPAAVAEEKDTAKVGKPAPDIELPATQIDAVLPDKKEAKTLSLKDLQGKKNVVLYFFPKAMTPGCTTQSCGFRDLNKEFAKLDTVIIGISTDNIEAQMKFTERDNLNFPLFADADKTVTKKYGVLRQNGFAQRTTFVIDKKGVVRKIFANANAKQNPQEVLDYVKENLTEK